MFQPLGGRFLEAREDAARIVALLREDAFHAENGHFTRMTLRVDSQLADRLAGLEPRAVERRLQEATRDAVLRERPRAQGVYLVRFEPSARGGLEPVAHVHLSCRTSDGGPAPALTREDARRFEAAWTRDVEKAFGIARGLDRDQDRASALDPEAEQLRQEWARASARLFGAYTERLHGNATHQELADALANARTARAAWSRAAGPPARRSTCGTSNNDRSSTSCTSGSRAAPATCEGRSKRTDVRCWRRLPPGRPTSPTRGIGGSPSWPGRPVPASKPPSISTSGAGPSGFREASTRNGCAGRWRLDWPMRSAALPRAWTLRPRRVRTSWGARKRASPSERRQKSTRHRSPKGGERQPCSKGLPRS